MSEALQDKKYYTEEEYLALEEKADYKSEYYDGEIFMMAGANRRHNLISLHLGGALNTVFVGKPSEAYVARMRVNIASQRIYTYPDVIAVCGEPQFLTNSDTTLVNPTVLFEILSKSTRKNDRGVKFSSYREIPTLIDYILIDQSRIAVEHYHKLEEDNWHIRIHRQLSSVLVIESIGFEISLERIYDKIKFEPPKAKKGKRSKK